jgi:hyperosmotically inducible protein
MPTFATPAPTAPAIAADPTVAPAAAVAATDSQITTDVKSQIAGDSPGKDPGIGVSTTNGVVALSGSLASQDAIDHVRIVVASVKDVKSVDTSALTVSNL